VDPDTGSGAFLTPGFGMGNKSGARSGMVNPDHISECLETIFWGKLRNFCDADPVSGIREGKNSVPGSGINIPDPQHCPVGYSLDATKQFHLLLCSVFTRVSDP
jgi:hypothetical protein